MLLTARARWLLAVAVASACSGTPDGDGGARDAAADAGRDAGRDAAPRDVGTDAWEPPDAGPLDPEWVRVPGFPDDCYVEYARHPERVVGIEWRNCRPPMPVCTYGAVFPRAFQVMSNRATYGPERGAWLFYAGLDENGSGGRSVRTRATLDSSGVALAAARATSANFHTASCTAMFAAGSHAIAMRADLFGETSTPPRPFAQYRGAQADWFDHPLPPGDLASLPYPGFVQGFWSSDSASASDIALGGYVLISRDAEPTRRFDARGYASIEDIVGDHVFWSVYYEGPYASRVYHSGADDTDQLLLDGAGTATEYRDLDVTDTAMAWYVVTNREADGTISGGNLMVADFATTMAELTPRTLRTGCTGGECLGPCLGNDAVAYAYLTDPGLVDTLDLLTLTDGARSRVELPSSPRDWSFGASPLWVDETEVAVPAIGPLREFTLLRIPRTSFVPVP